MVYQPISLPEGEMDLFRKQERPKLDELFLTPEKIAEEEGADMDNDYYSRYPPRLKDGAGGDNPKAYEQRVVSLGHVQGSRVIQGYAWKIGRLVKGDRVI